MNKFKFRSISESMWNDLSATETAAARISASTHVHLGFRFATGGLELLLLVVRLRFDLLDGQVGTGS